MLSSADLHGRPVSFTLDSVRVGLVGATSPSIQIPTISREAQRQDGKEPTMVIWTGYTTCPPARRTSSWRKGAADRTCFGVGVLAIGASNNGAILSNDQNVDLFIAGKIEL